MFNPGLVPTERGCSAHVNAFGRGAARRGDYSPTTKLAGLLALIPPFVWLLACAAQGQELPPMTSRGKPGILRVNAEPLSVPRFGKLELTIDLSASYDNPFDPEQVDLTADFTTPSGRKVTVPGFFYQAYTNRNEGDDAKRPMLDAVGEPCWKVRFAPTEVGEHTYLVRLRNRFEGQDATTTSPLGRFASVESKAPGFIRVCAKNGRYFQFDDGSAFFPVGHNLQNDWPVYRHSRLLAEGGANCARVWTFCHWTWLEWSFKGDLKWAKSGDWMRSYAGAGRYNQRIAWV
ncbi:MAG: DUF5060 domain-containing protein, partial [Planctomycetes bacterium]|nr:DUF5060 domain-containing protein [Planctomycetota bacterium]